MRLELDIEKAQWHKTRLGISFCAFDGGMTSFSLSFEFVFTSVVILIITSINKPFKSRAINA